MPKLPNILHVRYHDDDDELVYLVAEPTIGACVENLDTGESVDIGIYKLTAPPKRYLKTVAATEI